MQKLYTFALLPILFFMLTACGTDTKSDTAIEPISDTPTSTTPVPPSTPAPSTPTSSASIDVLVLYDKEVQSAYSDVNTRVNHLFAVSNNIYRDSGLNITINAKKILFLMHRHTLPLKK